MASDTGLTDRDREILREVVRTYLLTAEPVSSRTVAKRSGQELSAASIRNVMADLDELGLLAQPHTSAGRVPTAAGYHMFIENLMQTETLPEQALTMIEGELASARDGSELTAASAHLLQELSNQVSIVMTPATGDTVLKRIELAPLSGERILCVTVSSAGFIENKILDDPDAGDGLSREELVRISNYLNQNFAGQTLTAIRDRLLELMEDERATMDALLRNAIVLASQGLSTERGAEVLVQGTEALLVQPELADLERVRRLMATFADRARLVGMLNQCIEGDGVRVWIGEESDLTSELDFSLIVKQYGVDGQNVGSLGVFGPSRMEYSRLIPLVDYIGEKLSGALARAM